MCSLVSSRSAARAPNGIVLTAVQVHAPSWVWSAQVGKDTGGQRRCGRVRHGAAALRPLPAGACSQHVCDWRGRRGQLLLIIAAWSMHLRLHVWPDAAACFLATPYLDLTCQWAPPAQHMCAVRADNPDVGSVECRDLLNGQAFAVQERHMRSACGAARAWPLTRRASAVKVDSRQGKGGQRNYVSSGAEKAVWQGTLQQLALQ